MKALFILEHLVSFYDRNKIIVEGCGQAEWTIDCDDYKRINEAIAELEELIKPKSCKDIHIDKQFVSVYNCSYCKKGIIWEN